MGVTRARNVVHQLLEDGPEEINPKEFIRQYAEKLKPEVFMRDVAKDFALFLSKLEKIGVLQMLRKKYDDDVIAWAIVALAAERTPVAGTRKCLAEIKKLARFSV